MLFSYVLYHYRPDVTNRVFYHKLKDLMTDIRQNEYFGSVKALGIISHKKSLTTIFGHKHKVLNFIKKLRIFNQDYIKNDK